MPENAMIFKSIKYIDNSLGISIYFYFSQFFLNRIALRFSSYPWLQGCLKPKNNETYFHRGAPMCAVLFFDQGSRVSTQCNLLVGCCERILMQPWAQVMDYSLPFFYIATRLGIGISCLFISAIVICDRCYIQQYF